jgi:NAD(P)-dependent dehydrogenase (short-subunit alcohol dehydrogenase family)
VSKLILITGASSGIGRAAAISFAREGHRVIAGVRNQKAADELRANAKENLVPAFLDITDNESLDKFCEDYSGEFEESGLDGLINNAGTAVMGAVEFTSLKDWRRQYDVNVFGHVDLTQRLLPYIRKAQGRIIFTGSISGRVSYPFGEPYCSSKYALEGLADTLRRELHRFGVFVSIVEPGAIDTPMLNSSEKIIQEIYNRIKGEITYREVADGSVYLFEQCKQTAIHPDRVVDAFRKALFSTSPKARYLVGNDAKFMATLKAIMPDKLLDKILRKMMRL